MINNRGREGVNEIRAVVGHSPAISGIKKMSAGSPVHSYW